MKQNKNPNYIRIGIFTVITTLCWIFFSAYRTFTAKPTPTLSAKVLAPFNPDLDMEKIGEIESRIFFEEGQTQSIVGEVPTPTPEATQTPEPEPVPDEVLEEEPLPEEITQ